VVAVPLAANDRLDELYAVQRLVQAEVDRLQQEHDTLHEPPGHLRRYILNVQIEALQEEATRLSARISDVLERDLQR
jgi:prefoldin subunit 5